MGAVIHSPRLSRTVLYTASECCLISFPKSCRKFANKTRASKEQHRDQQNQHEIATGDAGLFSLINSRLRDRPRHEHHTQREQTKHGLAQEQQVRQSKFADSSKAPAALKPQDRKSLIAHQASDCACFVRRSRELVSHKGQAKSLAAEFIVHVIECHVSQ